MDTDQRMIEFVKQLINNSIAATYRYHNFNHTFYVYEKALEIAAHEQCSAHSIRLLKAAALWHDTGYSNTYYRHEEESCALMQKQLPVFDFTANEIEAITGMIMATKIPQTAHNLLEEIIADADLEYLGSNTAEVQANWLFEEMHSMNPTLLEEQWNRTQIKFIEKHQYLTNYCKIAKEPAKASYLKGLKLKL
jgi:uncharacterized protein